MSQVVDLGYVVGPTGPKDSDAILPETGKVHVYITSFLEEAPNVTSFYVKYLSNHQVVTAEVPVLDTPDAQYEPDSYSMHIECDFGSVVYFTYSDTSNINTEIGVTCYRNVPNVLTGELEMRSEDSLLTGSTIYGSVCMATLVPVDSLYVCLSFVAK